MKKLLYTLISIALSLMFFCALTNTAYAEYSSGYRMGQLTKYSLKGMFAKSGEGELLLGSESTVLYQYVTTTDAEGRESTTKKRVNPWLFSSTIKSIQNKLKQNIGNYVVLKYSQSNFNSGLNTDTAYEIKEVLDIAPSTSEVCIAKSYDKGSKSNGATVGRIIKASAKGHLVKSIELIIQKGNSGNQFKRMSISEDDSMLICAMKYLKAGQKAKIHYSESYINMSFDKDSNYDIVKIEPLKGLN